MIQKILLFAILTLATANAKEVKGVKFDDTTKVGTTTLKLNGIGMRKAYSIVDVYVAGLYVAEPTKDADAILKTTTPKFLRMHFKRWVQKGQLQDAWKEGFQKNRPDGYEYRKDLDKLNDSMKHMKDGDEMSITFYPEYAEIKVKEEAPVKIDGAKFSETLLKVFLKNPPDEDLKKGLLGEKN